MTVFRTLLVVVFAGAAALAADKFDDELKSENQATKSRPSALTGKSRLRLPMTVKRAAIKDEPIIEATNSVAITQRMGKDTLVGGKVYSVYVPKSGSPLILNFGPDHRNCFKVVIFEDAFPLFGATRAADIGRMYTGQTVVAGGFLTKYNSDVQIAASIPSQLLVVTP